MTTSDDRKLITSQGCAIIGHSELIALWEEARAVVGTTDSVPIPPTHLLSCMTSAVYVASLISAASPARRMEGDGIKSTKWKGSTVEVHFVLSHGLLPCITRSLINMRAVSSFL